MENKNQFGIIERVCMFCGHTTPHDPAVPEELNSCKVCQSTDFGIRTDGKLENPDGWMNKHFQVNHGIPDHKRDSHIHKCVKCIHPGKDRWCPQ